MKHIPLLILSLLASATHARADGIPVDRETGKVRCAHTVVSLTAEQIEETQTLGTFTLTSEQWRQLRAKRPGCLKRFNTVLPVTYSGCSCGVDGEYVIALSRDRIAVLLHGGSGMSLGSVREYLFIDTTVKLRANERGEFHVGGVLVPFPTLLKAFATRPDGATLDGNGKITAFQTINGTKHDGPLYLTVDLPTGAKPTDAVYQTRLKQIAAAADRIGITHFLFERDGSD